MPCALAADGTVMSAKHPLIQPVIRVDFRRLKAVVYSIVYYVCSPKTYMEPQGMEVLEDDFPVTKASQLGWGVASLANSLVNFD